MFKSYALKKKADRVMCLYGNHAAFGRVTMSHFEPSFFQSVAIVMVFSGAAGYALAGIVNYISERKEERLQQEIERKLRS